MLRFPFFLTELKQKLAAARQQKRKLRSSGKEVNVSYCYCDFAHVNLKILN